MYNMQLRRCPSDPIVDQMMGGSIWLQLGMILVRLLQHLLYVGLVCYLDYDYLDYDYLDYDYLDYDYLDYDYLDNDYLDNDYL